MCSGTCKISRENRITNPTSPSLKKCKNEIFESTVGQKHREVGMGREMCAHVGDNFPPCCYQKCLCLPFTLLKKGFTLENVRGGGGQEHFE